MWKKISPVHDMQSTDLCIVHLHKVYWSSCLYMIDKLGKNSQTQAPLLKFCDPQPQSIFFIIKMLIVLQILDMIFDKKKFIN